MRICVLITVIVLAMAIPLPFAAFNITTRAIDLPRGYTFALVDSDIMLGMPDHSFQTIPFLSVYIGMIALTLAALAVAYTRRKRSTRGFEVQPPTEP